MSVDDTLKHARSIKKTINRLEKCYCGVKAKDKLTDMQIQGYVFERMFILKRLESLLKRLPYNQMDVLWLYYGKGKALNEIAKMRDKSTIWVRRQLILGRHNLRRQEELSRW